LSADLDCTGTSGTVFTIAADSVVFDGQGYKVLAPSAALMVSSLGNSGVSILNMDLSGTASNGIKISGGSGNLVSSVDVSYTGVTLAGYGIQLESSTNNVIQNVTATNRNIGVWLIGTSGGNTIRDNNLSGNFIAINAPQLGQGNSYLNNDLSDSASWAITIYDDDAVQISGNDYTLAVNAILLGGVDGVTIDGENLAWTGAAGAGGKGLEMQNSTNNIVQNLTATNRSVGVRLVGTSGGNTIQNNNLSGNNSGIQATQLGQGNSYLNNDLSNTATWAITVWDDDAVQISGNDYTLAINGIMLGEVDGVTIDGENLAWTGPAGFGGIGLELQNSDGNTIQNLISTNRSIGVRITGTSSGNTIQNNDLSNDVWPILPVVPTSGNTYSNNTF
jgi:parallel beta-helix repeat protein